MTAADDRDRRLVAFVAGALSGRPPAPGASELCWPEALGPAGADRLAEAVRLGVLRFLCREIGWPVLPFVAPSADRVLRGRLWDARATGRLHLTFSTEALRMACAAMAVGPGSPVPPAVRQVLDRPPLAHNGDLLAHALLCRAVGHAAVRSPLLAVTAHPSADTEALAAGLACLERVLEPDLRPLLPWLLRAWAAAWAESEPLRFAGRLETVAAAHTWHARILSATVTLAVRRGALDLLAGPMRYYARILVHAGSPAGWLDRFEALGRGRRLVERRQAATAWLTALAPLRDIETARRQALADHPVDRTGDQALLLQLWSELELDRALAGAEAIHHAVLPGVGAA